MSEKLLDKEKAMLILEKSQTEFRELSKQVREMQDKIEELRKVFEHSNTLLKRVLNEEENGGNIHKDCEYYHEETDTCYNYLMGKYTGLAFEVSRHEKCINDIVSDSE